MTADCARLTARAIIDWNQIHGSQNIFVDVVIVQTAPTCWWLRLVQRRSLRDLITESKIPLP